MKEYLLKICKPHFDTFEETGKEIRLQLPFMPEKGDFVEVPGIASPCRVVARCFTQGKEEPTIYVIKRAELIRHTEKV